MYALGANRLSVLDGFSINCNLYIPAVYNIPSSRLPICQQRHGVTPSTYQIALQIKSSEFGCSHSGRFFLDIVRNCHCAGDSEKYQRRTTTTRRQRQLWTISLRRGEQETLKAFLLPRDFISSTTSNFRILTAGMNSLYRIFHVHRFPMRMK